MTFAWETGVAHLPHHFITYFYITMPSGQTYSDLVGVAYYLIFQYFLLMSFGIASVSLWSLGYVCLAYSR